MTEKDLRRAYFPDYFSIDNILACQTLIQCRTEMTIPKFGFLVPECNSEDLPAGMDLKLPLWAARVLCRPGRKYISVHIPHGLKEAHRQVVDDEPTSADLKKVHQQYFETGHLCTSLFHNDAGELAEMLPEILQQRILCIGESTITQPRNQFVHQISSPKAIPNDYLDKLEEKIHSDSKKGTEAVKQWLEPLERPLDFPITRSQNPTPPQRQHYSHPTNGINSSNTTASNQYSAPSQMQQQSFQQNYHPVSAHTQHHPGLSAASNINPHGSYPAQHHYHPHHQMR